MNIINQKFSPRVIISLLAICATFTFTLIGNTGGAPAGYTNAPGESDCTSCHSGTLQTSGTNYNNISLIGDFTGGGYIPDSTYTITLTYTHTGKRKFGYQLTCLDGQDKMAGSFTLVSGNNKSRINSASILGGNRSYLNQTSAGTSGTGSITWEFKWTAPATNKGDVTFYTVVNSTNNGSGNAGDIIIAREFKIVPSNLLPEATASAVDSTICAGSRVSLEGSGTNSPTSWSWSIPTGNPSISTEQNPKITMPFAGKFEAILTVINAKGKSLPDTVEIEVLASPTAFIPGPSSYTICEGDSIELTATNQIGNDYTWMDGTRGRTIWAKDTGEYYVNVENFRGCGKQSNRIEIKYHPKPQAALLTDASNQNDTLCTSSPITLNASTSLLDSFFFFADNSLLSKSVDSFLIVQFEKRTTYGLVVMDSLGCLSDRDDYEVEAVIRQEAPKLSCVATSVNAIEFEWTSIAAHQGFKVSLDSGINWTDPTSGPLGLTHTVNGLLPEESITLFVRAFDDAPCNFSELSRATCITRKCEPLDVSVVYDSSICKGDLWTVEINGLSSEKYSLSLDGGGSFTDTTFAFNPTISKVYTLEVIDSNRLVCPAQSIEMDLIVDAIADIQLKSNKIGAFCEGEEITYSANDSIENFSFYVNDKVLQSGPTNKFIYSNFKNEDSTFVVVTKGKCIDTSEMQYISVELPAVTEFTYDRDGSVYTFTPVKQDYAKYTWDFGDGSPENTDIIAVHDYTSLEGTTVNVELDITTLANCKGDTAASILLPEFSNVLDLNRIGVNIYPNPARDYVVVSNESESSLDIEILTTTGILLNSRKLGFGENKISLTDYSPGILIVRIRTDNGSIHYTLIKR